MFIFANTFEMLHTKLLTDAKESDNFELYPLFQVLEYTSGHLSKRLFDTVNASIDDPIKITLLRYQLHALLDYKTTSKLFGQIFGEKVDSKHSIFEDQFNP
jgi:hypothetical protein